MQLSAGLDGGFLEVAIGHQINTGPVGGVSGDLVRTHGGFREVPQ